MDIAIIRELGSLGIIGVVFIYLFKVYLPRKDKMHQEALDRQLAFFKECLDGQGDTFRVGVQSLAARITRNSQDISGLAEQLREHEQREEVQLETHTGLLTNIESHLRAMAEAS